MAEKPTVMAVQKALESAKKRNFTETVELAINLKDVDLTVPKNRITEDIILPKNVAFQKGKHAVVQTAILYFS